MTFVFDGHGGPDGLYMSGGDIMEIMGMSTEKQQDAYDNLKISSEELAQAFREREAKFGKESVQKDIIVIEACYNHTFLRSFYEKLADTNNAKPIVLGASEYGQVGYSKKDSQYGSEFYDALFDGEKISTLGDVFIMGKLKQHNPSLYIPTENEMYGQIAQNDQPSEGLMAA